MNEKRTAEIAELVATMEDNPLVGFGGHDGTYNIYLDDACEPISEQWHAARVAIRELLAEVERLEEDLWQALLERC
jgi:hypothetical protein